TSMGFPLKKLYARTSSNPATWSLCGCVNTIASSILTFARSIWQRKSGPESTARVVVADLTRMLERSLLSFLSFEVHTSQLQPIIGIPPLVPVPRYVMVSEGYATLQI